MSQSKLQREEEFHNRWARSLEPDGLLVEETWNAETSPERRWMREQLPDLRGKRVLDIGCGAGEGALWFALQGAEVVASDLAPDFLELVERAAERYGVHLTTHLAQAGELDFPEASFDIIYAANVLHHVPNPNELLDTCQRLLKPGGWLVTMDPLRHNPIIDIYRRLAQGVRTVDERPLDIGILDEFRRRFTEVRYECFWFLTLWIFMQFFLFEWVHPSKDRYWIKIYRDHRRLARVHAFLRRLDVKLLHWFPFLKPWCWNLAVVARK